MLSKVEVSLLEAGAFNSTDAQFPQDVTAGMDDRRWDIVSHHTMLYIVSTYALIDDHL